MSKRLTREQIERWRFDLKNRYACFDASTSGNQCEQLDALCDMAAAQAEQTKAVLQEDRFFVSHGVVHDRKMGRHLHFDERAEEQCVALNAIEKATAHLGGMDETYLNSVSKNDAEAFSTASDPSEGLVRPAGFNGEIRDVERMGDGGNWTLSMPAIRYLLQCEQARELRQARWRWIPIDSYDSLREKPALAVFFFRAEPGRIYLGSLIQTTRIYGHRVCTHWMPLPSPPEEK